MNPQPQHFKRQSHRLRNYDYRQPGAYFITICTHSRTSLFGASVDGQMQYTHLGQIAEVYWKLLPKHFSNLELDVWQVMPDHLHGILILKDGDGSSRSSSPQQQTPVKDSKLPHGTAGGSIGAIIQCYKKVTTRKVRQLTGDNEFQLWQRDYYDHVIRSESDMNRIREYIIQNPSAWHEDPDNRMHP